MTVDDPLYALFFPEAVKRVNEFRTQGLRLVYYTSAATALQIIQGKEIWLRNAAVMNDYAEIAYGRDALSGAIGSDKGHSLVAFLNNAFDGLGDTSLTRFEAWAGSILSETYITCVSEHPAEEDMYGRLSMWRAYGGEAGVALVINADFLDNHAPDWGVISSPVTYADDAHFQALFAEMVDGILQEREFVASANRQLVARYFENAMIFAATCTKHPGFLEEREWRLLANTRLWPAPKLRSEVAVLRNVPQVVMKMPLGEFPDLNVTASIPALLSGAIIGPCDHPQIVAAALVNALQTAGVRNAIEYVTQSDIPLRHR